MAIRIKTKWHRTKRKGAQTATPKTLLELASVVAFNLWKVAQEPFRRMEKEGFRFAQDVQVTGFITEFIAYLSHSVDRLLYTRVDDTERAQFMNALVQHLAQTMATESPVFRASASALVLRPCRCIRCSPPFIGLIA